MRENHTVLGIVIDRSGSMSNIMSEIISSYNNLINDQKKQPGTAEVFLASFDNQYEVIHNHVNIHAVPDLTYDKVSPRGMTALNDAFGRTISSIGSYLSSLPESKRASKVIIAVFTDGGENASIEYRNRSDIKTMVEHQQQKYSWSFLFFGANQDAVVTGSTFGVNANNSVTFTAKNVATANTMSYASAATSYLRSAPSTNYTVSSNLASFGRRVATSSTFLDPNELNEALQNAQTSTTLEVE